MRTLPQTNPVQPHAAQPRVLLEARNIHKRFGSHEVLRGVSLQATSLR